MGIFPEGYTFDFEFALFGSWLVFMLITCMAERGDFNWIRDFPYPVLTVDASIVSKSIEVNPNNLTNVYSAIFLTEDGKRLNLTVPNKDQWMLTKGNAGKLTYKGYSYIGFVIERSAYKAVDLSRKVKNLLTEN